MVRGAYLLELQVSAIFDTLVTLRVAAVPVAEAGLVDEALELGLVLDEGFAVAELDALMLP
jgi:hypothetical protein